MVGLGSKNSTAKTTSCGRCRWKIEECQLSCRMSKFFNSTFLALFLKVEKPLTFDEFRPISLCNCVYKIISKIIALCIKPILSRMISKEQFAFLSHRQIHEAIGTAQEVLHSIKTLSKKVVILKIDLSKTFDRVSWSYIQLILTQIGFPHPFINWIMCCFTSMSFSVLVNGAALGFFHTERWLRQGCPISPLLFLLIMEGLTRLLKNVRSTGAMEGVSITDRIVLSHILFVDDVIIFLNGSFRDSSCFKSILSLFCKATCM